MFFISFLPPDEHTSTQPLRRDYARLVRPVPTKNGSVFDHDEPIPEFAGLQYAMRIKVLSENGRAIGAEIS
jgi:hypothetical protein